MSGYLPQMRNGDVSATWSDTDDAEYGLLDSLICFGGASSSRVSHYQAEIYIPGNNFRIIFIFTFS